MRPLRAAALLAALALACAAAPAASAQSADPSSGCSGHPQPMRFMARFPVDGVQRSALVNVPAQASRGRPLPLVLMFHGAGGTGPTTETATGMTPVATRYGAIVVYPTANGKYWNLSGGGVTGNDDVEFVGSLLDQLDGDLCIDDSRIYAAGVSNGGGFVSRLGCQLSGRLAGIATVAGLYGREPACTPSRPLSVLEIHGTSDQTVPYDGWGPGGVGSVWAFLSKWNGWDTCPSQPATWQRLAPGALWEAKSDCADGTKVAHIKLKGEPHAWPTPVPQLSHRRPVGIPFDASTAVVQFFTSGTVSSQTALLVRARSR